MKQAKMRRLVSVFAVLLLLVFSATGHAGETLRDAPPPAQKKLLVFGDSLVAGYGVPVTDSFPAQLEKKLKEKGHDIKVINAGVSGDTTSGGVTRLEWTLAQKPDYMIVVLGGNDMLRQVDAKVTRDNLDKIVKTARGRGIPVLLGGMQSYRNLADIQGGGIEKIYKDVATAHGALLYPFFLEGVALDAALNLNDGIHPNRAGIAKIVDNIYPMVEKLIGQ